MRKSEQLGTQTEPDSDSSQGSARTNTASNPQLEQILARLVENQSKPQYIRNTEVIKKFPDTDPDCKFSRFRFLFSKYVHEPKYSEAGCFSKFIKLLGGGALTFALSLQLEEKKGTAPQYSMDQWFQKFEKEYSDEAAKQESYEKCHAKVWSPSDDPRVYCDTFRRYFNAVECTSECVAVDKKSEI